MALHVAKYLANQAWTGKLRDLLVNLFTSFLREILLAGSGVTVTYDTATGSFTFAAIDAAESWVGTATEALTAGRFVSVDALGEIQHADSSVTNKLAVGFVLASYADGATNVRVYKGGDNTQLSGLTLGHTYYLSTAGQVTLTPPATLSHVVQQLGTARSATTLATDIQQPIKRPTT